MRKQKQPVIDARRPEATTNEGTNATLQHKGKTQMDLTLITRAFTQHFIFNNLTQENREAVIQGMQFFTIDEGKTLFE